MKAIKATTMAMALAGTAGLAGCSTVLDSARALAPDYDLVDGRRCGSSTEPGPVFIDVTYAADGTPRNPGDCTVDNGTQVTWRGPNGEPVSFEIHFKASAPLAYGERSVLPSAENGGRHKVIRRIEGAAGRYNYGIRANGKDLDPAIIIR